MSAAYDQEAEDRDDKFRDGGFAAGVSCCYERSEAGGYRDQWGWHDDAPDEDEPESDEDDDTEDEGEGDAP